VKAEWCYYKAADSQGDFSKVKCHLSKANISCASGCVLVFKASKYETIDFALDFILQTGWV
jgi:hypothetical protein